MSAKTAVSGQARRLVGRGVKAAALAADAIAPPPRGLIVLGYHQVGAPRDSEVNLSPGVFAEQMAWLAHEARVVSLDEGVAAVQATSPPPRDQVAVTFDDGTADFVDVALPILVEHGIPATLYLATQFVEQQRSFWDDGTVLSWAALREATSTGIVSIGSHTHRHALLDRIDPAEVDDELDRSVGLIAEHLQVEARHFAYPKALPPSPAADRAVRQRFDSAAIAGCRPNRYGATDPYLLSRSPVQRSDARSWMGRSWFVRKAGGGLRLEGRLREELDRRRYAGATR